MLLLNTLAELQQRRHRRSLCRVFNFHLYVLLSFFFHNFASGFTTFTNLLSANHISIHLFLALFLLWFRFQNSNGFIVYRFFWSFFRYRLLLRFLQTICACLFLKSFRNVSLLVLGFCFRVILALFLLLLYIFGLNLLNNRFLCFHNLFLRFLDFYRICRCFWVLSLFLFHLHLFLDIFIFCFWISRLWYTLLLIGFCFTLLANYWIIFA